MTAQKLMKPFLIIIFTSLSISISKGQMSGFRGPERSGIYNEKVLLKTWPASGPQLIWETTGIGKGQSSATVTDDAIYITGRKGENSPPNVRKKDACALRGIVRQWETETESCRGSSCH